jgi:ubiquinone/menaquinone biosynthesis C-methylase UbiE
MQTKNKTISFVDFYRDNNFSPVSQDIHDLQKHYGRRESLYRLLGIAPKLVKGLDILELCPGSGHNSLYIQSLQPLRYTLVDGNPFGIQEAKRLFAYYYPDARNVFFVESLINDYASDDQFDLVLCEGAIPFQNDPESFTLDLCRFVANNGLLVITCVDPISGLGECIRRLIAAKISPATAPIQERLRTLRPIFNSHLASLKGASRPIDDWVYDNILQPFTGKTFSIEQAIGVLSTCGFEVYGASPRFQNEWRWYKDLTPGQTEWNHHAIEYYHCNVINFLDHRFHHEPHDAQFGLELINTGNAFYSSMQRFEQGVPEELERATAYIKHISELIRPLATETADCLDEAHSFLSEDIKQATTFEMNKFPSFFGRSQQYLSFIKSL